MSKATIVNRDEALKRYQSSNEPSAQNWEYSVLWHGEQPKSPKGIQGPFTVLNRTPKGRAAVYPPITLDKGTMEYFILDGEFICNEVHMQKDDYALFESNALV